MCVLVKDQIRFEYINLCVRRVYVYAHIHPSPCMEIRGQVSGVLSFHHVGSRYGAQVVRLGGRSLHRLCHLTSQKTQTF